jgi:hypothetical protein
MYELSMHAYSACSAYSCIQGYYELLSLHAERVYYVRRAKSVDICLARVVYMS